MALLFAMKDDGVIGVFGDEESTELSEALLAVGENGTITTFELLTLEGCVIIVVVVKVRRNVSRCKGRYRKVGGDLSQMLQGSVHLGSEWLLGYHGEGC